MKLAIKLAIILLMAMPCVAQVQIGNGGSMQVGANVSVTGCGVSAPCTVVQGGTGATTASSAWTNIFSGAGIATNCAVLSTGSGGALTCSPISYLPLSGGTITGDLNMTGTFAAPSLAVNGGTKMTANQGNGASVQHSTGATTTNDCVKYDANGNTVDAGAACGTGSAAFSSLTSGTNNAMAGVLGTSASIDVGATGTSAWGTNSSNALYDTALLNNTSTGTTATYAACVDTTTAGSAIDCPANAVQQVLGITVAGAGATGYAKILRLAMTTRQRRHRDDESGF